MSKQLPRKLRYTFIGSLVLNVLLILWTLLGFFMTWYLDTSGALDHAAINAYQHRFCEQYYQRMLDNIDKQYGDDPQRAADLKNSYAINVCLKNYKTGERLDIQPLIDQVK
jgi:hypothetical protein